MRLFFLKCLGLALWALFLFAPFIARADDGSAFDFPAIQETLPQASFEQAPTIRNLSSQQQKNTWKISLKAGRDDPLSHGPFPSAPHRYTRPDTQGQKAFRLGLHLNYVF